MAVVGFAPYDGFNDVRDLPHAKQVIKQAAEKADVVIVQVHMGAEGRTMTHVKPGPEIYVGENRGDPVAFSKAVIDAGADLVIGHGPHVLRGMEWYRGHLIAYSLGNFATYRGFSLAGPLGITGVLQVQMGADGRVTGGRLVPMMQAPRRGPAPDASGTAVTLLNELSAQDFGADAVRLAPDGRLLPPADR